VSEIVQEQPPVEGLVNPGEPLVLTVAVTMTGKSATRYTIEPELAIETLRNIADQIEAEVAEAEALPNVMTGSGAPREGERTVAMEDLDEEIDRLHGPGAAAALDAALEDGTIFSDEVPD
jgi:hypothetical protein